MGARDQVYADYNTDLGKYRFYNKYWTLPAYHYMNLGVSYRFPCEAVTLSFDVLNLYQTIGLEEGNSRELGVKTYYYVARPILPQRAMLSASYRF